MRSNADQARELTRKEPRGSEALDVAGPSNTAEPGERAETNDETVDGLKKSPRPVAAGKALQENAESRESSLDIHSDKLAAGANREETASEEIHAKPERNELEAKRDAIAERSEAGNPAPAFEVGDHTEIHITIGSVELRAPRVAPVPPRSPAFRPRVTLDEFLKRGSGPGGRGARP
jgi:hypothetical protein